MKMILICVGDVIVPPFPTTCQHVLKKVLIMILKVIDIAYRSV
jgi:hypothetical protein